MKVKRVSCVRQGWGMLLWLICTVSLTACGTRAPILIGFAGCITGFSAGLGVNARYGAELAVETVNGSGGIKGRRLELVVKDDQNNPETALAVDKELKEAGVVAIVGHLTSDMGRLTVPWINDSKLVMMSPTVSDPALTGKDDWFFRVIPENTAQSRRVEAAMVARNVRKAAIVYENTNLSYSKKLAEEFAAVFQRDGGEIVLTEAFETGGDSGFSGMLDRVAASGAEALFLISSSDNAVKYLQMRAKSASKCDVYLAMWSISGGFLERTGATSEGVYLVDVVDFTSNFPAYLTFKDKYQSQFGDKPNFASVFGYESVMILAEAMNAAKTIDSAGIRTKLLEIPTFSGLQGKIAFDEYGDVQRETFLYQVQDGKIMRVE